VASPLELLREAVEGPLPVAVATVVEVRGAAPVRPGARLVVRPDGSTMGTVGGGRLEALAAAAAREALRGGPPRLLRWRLDEPGVGMWCGGEVAVFVEGFRPRRRVWIFGHGHVGREVLAVLAGLEVEPVVVHHREVPGVRTHLIDWERVEPFPEVGPEDAVLLLTREPEFELEALRRLATTPPAFVGVIGSRGKGRRLREALAGRGVDPAALPLRVPVGLPIGARTPREIAISIVAQLIGEWNGAQDRGAGRR